jgi:hypothetical protein
MHPSAKITQRQEKLLKNFVDNAWDANAEEEGGTSKKRRPIKGREEGGKFSG